MNRENRSSLRLGLDIRPFDTPLSFLSLVLLASSLLGSLDGFGRWWAHGRPGTLDLLGSVVAVGFVAIVLRNGVGLTRGVGSLASKHQHLACK